MQGPPRTHARRAPITSKPTASLFAPLGYFMVRAPLFPVEAYQQLGASALEHESVLSVANPRVRLALAVGSLSLLDEIERPASRPRDVLRREQKLLRYLIRMSTRPTPYGLFAGVALGHWGEMTDLSIADPLGRLQAQLDMGWLLPLIWKLEALSQVRQHLRFVANTAAYLRNGRVFLHERAVADAAKDRQEVSVRATGAVKRALELARQPIAYQELAAALCASISGATPEKVEGLLKELWQQTLLLSDLRPPLTGDLHPACYLQERLATIPSASALAEHLAVILQELDAWDATPLEATMQRYRWLLAQIKLLHQVFDTSFGITVSTPDSLPISNPLVTLAPTKLKPTGEENTQALLQVDMGLALAGHTLTSQVGADVARLAEVLLRLTPFPRGPITLTAYRKAFLERYGPDREVALVELLDQNFGLGPLETLAGTTAQGQDEHQPAKRNQTLIDLALTAQQQRKLAIELDDPIIKRLETWTPDPATTPYSLDLNIFIAAASAADLDAGRYQLILGPNIGGQEAGRNFGRFASLLGREGMEVLRQTASRVTQLAPQTILAELVYLPSKGRTSNVALRPAVYPYELTYATSPGVTADQTIPFDELVIGLRGDRLYLRWPQKQAEILPRASHMLNTLLAAPLIRLLSAISLDGKPIVTSFDWGEAARFPFLPRVQMGRLVLSLAQWRLTAETRERDLPTTSAEGFHTALSTWRACWNVPRYVYLRVADNRLLLDLETPQQREELRTELRKLQEGASITLQEVFPTLDQLWVEGPGGHYVTEWIFPLIQQAAISISDNKQRMDEAGSLEPSAPLATSPLLVSTEQRLKGMGSEWLFMKLYCGRDLQEDLIAGPLRALAHDALKEGLADEWFVMRYADPDPHLRLRFRGDPPILTGKLVPLLCAWGTWLMTKGPCLKYTFDTYDRELERYGGLEGIELAEALFGGDSRAVAELLALLTPRGTLDLDKKLLAVLTVDELLVSLGVSAAQRLAWYRQRVQERHQTGPIYRQKSAQLRALLSHPGPTLEAFPGGGAVLPILGSRRAALATIATRLAALEAEHALSKPLSSLYGSYVHLHCNRLLGLDHAAEEEVLGLLLRTHESLERAPVASVCS
jgi:thiopeptide-type bacteriocin biosynthesis protein